MSDDTKRVGSMTRSLVCRLLGRLGILAPIRKLLLEECDHLDAQPEAGRYSNFGFVGSIPDQTTEGQRNATVGDLARFNDKLAIDHGNEGLLYQANLLGIQSNRLPSQPNVFGHSVPPELLNKQSMLLGISANVADMNRHSGALFSTKSSEAE